MEENLNLKKLKGDKSIWAIVLILLFISIATVYSSSRSLAFRSDKSSLEVLMTHTAYILGGIAVMYVAYRFPLGWYRGGAFFFLLLGISLLVATLFVGKSINGAERWLKIFGVSFQPAELAKITLVIFLAKMFEKHKFDTYRKFFIKVVLPSAIVIILIFWGSLSAAGLLSFTVFLLFIIFKVKFSYIFKTLLIAFAAIVIMVGLNYSFGLFPRIDTGIKRFERYIDKKSNLPENLTPEQIQEKADKTYQENMAKVAVSSSGILGKGPGNSTQRYLLPHPYSDFIFAIITEEWGLVGAVSVLLFYLIFLFRSLMLANRCQQLFSMITVTGIALLITNQAFLHILVNVGMWPVTGQTLPLISLGGSSIIFTSGAIGIILSVSRTIEKSDEAPVKKEEQEYGKEI